MLTGYRVVNSLILDGAGRTRAVLDPYYVDSGGGAYVDPRVTADWGTAKLAATVASYDELGRPVCTARVALLGPNPAPLGAAACVSSPPGKESDSSFVLATGTAYRTFVLDGRALPAVESIPPEPNVGTVLPGFVTVTDTGGNVLATVDPQGSGVRFSRDPLGRVTGTSRRADVSSPTGEIRTSAAYNPGRAHLNPMEIDRLEGGSTSAGGRDGVRGCLRAGLPGSSITSSRRSASSRTRASIAVGGPVPPVAPGCQESEAYRR